MAVAKQHLDFVNLMTYDYHGSWDTATNFMAPWSDPAVSERPAMVAAAVACIVLLSWINRRLQMQLPLAG